MSALERALGGEEGARIADATLAGITPAARLAVSGLGCGWMWDGADLP
eukprot:gene26986-65834_t